MALELKDTTSQSIRQAFIDYFVHQNHTFVPSSPVVPHGDPTLLFANAGMNQFKPIFLGQVDPKSEQAKWRRAVNSQKCIRAGGKHNDLEDVGKDTYHHTFFEMLGNWSFGDYFKEEAIRWAWELLSEVYKLNKERIYVTYFGGDKKAGLEPDYEARDIWLKYLPTERVLPYGMKENFWEMGDTGPCGPCSEIHFDKIGGRDATTLVNADDPTVIEIWNNVFIQFNREPDGSLRVLPSKHVDTGMGLERLCSIIQGVGTNYDTDLFSPIFAAIKQVTGYPHPYGGRVGKDDVDNVDTAYRVIADHIRTLTFSINDGALPSNEGRGYVLRRILRRAVRYGKQILGAKTGFFHTLVNVVVEKLSPAFPELKKNPQHIIDVLRDEEEGFGKTLDKGLLKFDRILKKVIASGSKVVHAADAWKLYNTYGFPVDLTRLMAAEKNISVDEIEFLRLKHEFEDASRPGIKKGGEVQIRLNDEGVACLKKSGLHATDDLAKYAQSDLKATIKALWSGKELVHSFSTAEHDVAVILDKTNFYAEQGGQIFDTGAIAKGESTFAVHDVQTFGGYVIHVVKLAHGHTLTVGEEVTLKVDYHRRGPIKANHTSTHMLNYALRSVLGNGVDQKGSLVDNHHLRFDFSHGKPLTTQQIQSVDTIVSDLIIKELGVFAKEVPLADAKTINGLRAVFGEVYPDPVRVVSVGRSVEDLLSNPSSPEWNNLSIELCGGTHLGNTKEAVAFTILTEDTVGSGVRRLLAVTGEEARKAFAEGQRMQNLLDEAAKLQGDKLDAEVALLGGKLEKVVIPAVTRDHLHARLEKLRDIVKEAAKAKHSNQQKDAGKYVESVVAQLQAHPTPVMSGVIEAGTNNAAMSSAIKGIQDKCPGVAVLLLSTDQKKVSIVAQVPPELVAKGLKANEWAQAVAPVVSGKGGGKPEVAQAAGSDPSKVQDAVAAALLFGKQKLGL